MVAKTDNLKMWLFLPFRGSLLLRRPVYIKTEKGRLPPGTGLSFPIVLSTETKLLDDISVSLDVNLLEVVKDTTPLTDELQEGTTGCEVLLVVFQMLGEVSDTVGK